VFFQVKYVYDCEKPALASVVIIAGRVNASESKIRFGSTFRTSPISHSQNGTGFVCGLSTRKTRTPLRTQWSITSRSASHSPRQSSDSKLTL
jgi:hypothetical protein